MRFGANAVGLGLALIVTGCAGGRASTTGASVSYSPTCPSSQALAARIGAQATVRPTTASTEVIGGVRVDPPPPNTRPQLAATRAYEAALQGAGRPDPGPRPTITLAMVSSSTVHNQLSWVAVLTDAAITSVSGGPAPIPGRTLAPARAPCYVGTNVIAVDALNGSMVLAAAQALPGH